MKKIFSLILVGILGIGLVTGCGCDKKKVDKKDVLDDTESNTVIKDQKVEGLDIIDFVVLLENNISTVYFEVANNTEEAKNYEKIECSMYDKDGNVLYSFEKDLGNLEPLESKDIEYKVDINLTKTATVEYVLK